MSGTDIIAAGISAGANLLGGKLASDANIKFQKKFAKNAVQWKVADALKAGIHPLYALGAPTMSPSASVGGLGEGLAAAGQDISRAIEAGGNAEDRAVRKLALEKAGLENEYLRSQIARARSGQSTVPSPVGGTSIIAGQQQDVMTPQGLIKGTPGVASAQTATNEVGEGADILYGVQLGSKIMGNAFNPIAEDLMLMNDALKRGSWSEAYKYFKRAAIGR